MDLRIQWSEKAVGDLGERVAERIIEKQPKYSCYSVHLP